MGLASNFPWRRFSIETGWTPAEVDLAFERLLSGDPRGRSMWDGSHWPGGFHLAYGGRPRARWPLVLARGDVEATAFGSRVEITLRPPLQLVISLVGGLPLLSLVVTVVSVVAVIREQLPVLIIWTIPTALWWVAVRSFSADAGRAEGALRRFFPLPRPTAQGPFR